MPIISTADEVADRILGGEDSQTEFKAPRLHGGSVTGAEANPESFAGEMVAFANEAGGIILLGVEDDRSLAGYSADDAGTVGDWVVNVARNNVLPPLNPVLRNVALEGPNGIAYVVVVHIEPGLAVHRTTGGRWYRRIGRDKRDLDHVEMERLLHERGAHHAYDESPVPGATRDDLDEGLLEAVFPPREETDWSRLLRNSRVVSAESPTRPTLAGLVAFGRQPGEHLPQAVIRAVVYRGGEMDGDVVHEQDLDGPAGRQIDQAIELVDHYMRRGSAKDVGRRDRPQFHLGAVMEAIVNAVAHRDYAVVGSRIRLLVFDDRLEVASPGGLPNTLDVESMRFRQYTRNQLLVSFLSKLRTPDGDGYIEERGEGVERIVRLSTELSGREPEYHLHGDELRLTIWGS